MDYGKALVVEVAEGLALLDSAEAYLYSRTYSKEDFGYTQETVAILREASRKVRANLATLIGASLNY